MKVAVYYGPMDMRIEERPVPMPGPGQMLVKIEYCGICGTDVESFRRAGMIPPGMVFGHENVGTVAALGEGVEGFTVGERILCGPPAHCAEDCTPCRHGQTNICTHGFMRTAGIRTYDGGYAEYMLIHDAAHTMLIPVAEGTDPKEAVLFDVVCVAFHAIRRSRFRLGDDVVVSGAGPIGLSAMRLLRAAGAGRIIALVTGPAKAELVRSFGADEVIDLSATEDLKSRVLEILGRDVGADVVFECAGSPASLENCAYYCVKPGGQVMLVGTNGQPMGIAPNRIIPREIDLTPSFVYTAEEVEAYLRMLASGKLRFRDLVTDTVPLSRCVELGLDRPDRRNHLKILIDPSLG